MGCGRDIYLFLIVTKTFCFIKHLNMLKGQKICRKYFLNWLLFVMYEFSTFSSVSAMANLRTDEYIYHGYIACERKYLSSCRFDTPVAVYDFPGLKPA